MSSRGNYVNVICSGISMCRHKRRESLIGKLMSLFISRDRKNLSYEDCLFLYLDTIITCRRNDTNIITIEIIKHNNQGIVFENGNEILRNDSGVLPELLSLITSKENDGNCINNGPTVSGAINYNIKGCSIIEERFKTVMRIELDKENT